MQPPAISQSSSVSQVTALLGELKKAQDGKAAGDPCDPVWQQIFTAVAEKIPFVALGCYTASPISKRPDYVRDLIAEVARYDEQCHLPLGAKAALQTGALLMGMQLSASAAVNPVATLLDKLKNAPGSGKAAADPCDPVWQQIYIAVAEQTPFLALGCNVESPLRPRADEIRQLIRECARYDEQCHLPLGAKAALRSAALLMDGQAAGAGATQS